MSDKPPLKALLVDDEEQLVEILKQVVEAIGMVGLTAHDGMEALEIYHREKPDIVISDIYMPQLNGIGLMQKIKKHDPKHPPVVLITGYAHYRQLLDNLNSTPDGFLEKPFDLRKIIEIIYSFFPDIKK